MHAQRLEVRIVEQRQPEIRQRDHVDGLAPSLEARRCRVNVTVGIAAEDSDPALAQPGQAGSMKAGAPPEDVARPGAVADKQDIALADCHLLGMFGRIEIGRHDHRAGWERVAPDRRD